MRAGAAFLLGDSNAAAALGDRLALTRAVFDSLLTLRSPLAPQLAGPQLLRRLAPMAASGPDTAFLAFAVQAVESIILALLACDRPFAAGALLAYVLYPPRAKAAATAAKAAVAEDTHPARPWFFLNSGAESAALFHDGGLGIPLPSDLIARVADAIMHTRASVTSVAGGSRGALDAHDRSGNFDAVDFVECELPTNRGSAPSDVESSCLALEHALFDLAGRLEILTVPTVRPPMFTPATPVSNREIVQIDADLALSLAQRSDLLAFLAVKLADQGFPITKGRLSVTIMRNLALARCPGYMLTFLCHLLASQDPFTRELATIDRHVEPTIHGLLQVDRVVEAEDLLTSCMSLQAVSAPGGQSSVSARAAACAALQPRTRTFNLFLHYASARGDKEAVKRFLTLMRQLGCKPDAVTVSAIAKVSLHSPSQTAESGSDTASLVVLPSVATGDLSFKELEIDQLFRRLLESSRAVGRTGSNGSQQDRDHSRNPHPTGKKGHGNTSTVTKSNEEVEKSSLERALWPNAMAVGYNVTRTGYVSQGQEVKMDQSSGSGSAAPLTSTKQREERQKGAKFSSTDDEIGPFNQLIQMYFSIGKPEKAISAFSLLSSAGLPSRADTFTILMTGLALAGSKEVHGMAPEEVPFSWGGRLSSEEYAARKEALFAAKRSIQIEAAICTSPSSENASMHTTSIPESSSHDDPMLRHSSAFDPIRAVRFGALGHTLADWRVAMYRQLVVEEGWSWMGECARDLRTEWETSVIAYKAAGKGGYPPPFCPLPLPRLPISSAGLTACPWLGSPAAAGTSFLLSRFRPVCREVVPADLQTGQAFQDYLSWSAASERSMVDLATSVEEMMERVAQGSDTEISSLGSSALDSVTTDWFVLAPRLALQLADNGVRLRDIREQCGRLVSWAGGFLSPQRTLQMFLCFYNHGLLGRSHGVSSLASSVAPSLQLLSVISGHAEIAAPFLHAYFSDIALRYSLGMPVDVDKDILITTGRQMSRASALLAASAKHDFLPCPLPITQGTRGFIVKSHALKVWLEKERMRIVGQALL
jgi:hypothetical protein